MRRILILILICAIPSLSSARRRHHSRVRATFAAAEMDFNLKDEAAATEFLKQGWELSQVQSQQRIPGQGRLIFLFTDTHCVLGTLQSLAQTATIVKVQSYVSYQLKGSRRAVDFRPNNKVALIISFYPAGFAARMRGVWSAEAPREFVAECGVKECDNCVKAQQE